MRLSIPHGALGVQHKIVREQRGDGQQRLDRQGGKLDDFDRGRGRIRHPARDLDVDPVRPPNGDGKLDAPRRRNHLQLHPGQRMEPVVNRDSQRQGIVRRCR